MAQLYGSRSTANGYDIGVDTNIGTSKTQGVGTDGPVLTLTRAAAVAAPSDVNTMNDGIYSEVDTVDIVDADVTINPENDYLAILQSTAGSAVLSPRAAGLILGKLIIDANSARASCIGPAAGPHNGLTLNGTYLIDPTDSHITSFNASTTAYNLTMSGEGKCAGTLTNHSLFLNFTTTSGVIDISDWTFDVTLADQKNCIHIEPTATGTLVDINNCPITVVGSGTQTTAINCKDGITYDVHDNTLNVTATNPTGIKLSNGASFVTTSAEVNGNTINLTGVGPGYQILIGDDGAPVNPNTITTPKIYDNVASGGNHGLMLGHVTDGEIYRNKTSGSVIGILQKETTTCKAYYNLVTSPTQDGLRSKGGDTDGFYNNTVFIPSGATTQGMYVEDSATGIIYRNNIIYTESLTSFIASIDAGTDATFDYNCYWVSDPTFAILTDTPFKIAGVAKTWAEWQTAGYDANSIFVDPLFVSSTNYQLQAGSPCINAGILISGIHDQAGYGGDIGGVDDRTFFPNMGSYGGIGNKNQPSLRGGTPT